MIIIAVAPFMEAFLSIASRLVSVFATAQSPTATEDWEVLNSNVEFRLKGPKLVESVSEWTPCQAEIWR